jgi:hypothetical protein
VVVKIEYHQQRLCGSGYSSVADIPCIVRSLTHLVMSSSVIIQPRALHSPGVWVLLFLTSCTPFSQRQLYVATINIIVAMVTRLVKLDMFSHRSAIWTESMKLETKNVKISLISVWLTYRFWIYIFRHFTQNNSEKQLAAPSCFFFLSAPDCSWNFMPGGGGKKSVYQIHIWFNNGHFTRRSACI